MVGETVNNNKKKSNDFVIVIIVLIFVYFIYSIFTGNDGTFTSTIRSVFDNTKDDFTIVASYDYKDMEDELVKYGKKHDIDVKIKTKARSKNIALKPR